MGNTGIIHSEVLCRGTVGIRRQKQWWEEMYSYNLYLTLCFKLFKRSHLICFSFYCTKKQHKNCHLKIFLSVQFSSVTLHWCKTDLQNFFILQNWNSIYPLKNNNPFLCYLQFLVTTINFLLLWIRLLYIPHKQKTTHNKNVQVELEPPWSCWILMQCLKLLQKHVSI